MPVRKRKQTRPNGFRLDTQRQHVCVAVCVDAVAGCCRGHAVAVCVLTLLQGPCCRCVCWLFSSDITAAKELRRKESTAFDFLVKFKSDIDLRKSITNRRFPEITGKDNLTVFSYSGRVKSPERRRQLRRADLRQF